MSKYDEAPESVKYHGGYDPSNPPFETESSEYDSNFPSEAEKKLAFGGNPDSLDSVASEESEHNLSVGGADLDSVSQVTDAAEEIRQGYSPAQNPHKPNEEIDAS